MRGRGNMSQPHILDDKSREDLYEGLIVSSTWTDDELIKAIRATPGISNNDLNVWPREDLVDEAIDLIEEHYNGEAFSIDAEGMFVVDMNTLEKDKKLMDMESAQQEPVDLATLGFIASGFSLQESLECIREQVGENKYGTLPMPFETPGGSRINYSREGEMSIISKGTDRDRLDEAFENLNDIPSSRERAIKLVGEMGMVKEQKVENESSMSM